jgi:E3 ubiquitin-protein ligase RNF14
MKEVCFKYTNGSEEERKDLIKRFGEARIKRAIEETSSMDLIVNTSKQCPNCKSWMQKLDGCNKMTCSKCHCYFCWLCRKVLSKVDPYAHFNSANSECFEKLFEGMVNENNNQDDDDDTEDSEDEDDDDDFDINNFIINDDDDDEE